MGLKFTIKKKWIVIQFLVLVSTAYSNPWEDASHIENHPFMALQPQGKPGPFYLELKMKPVPGRIVLVNLDLAERLGLLKKEDRNDPQKLKEFEKKLLDSFSYVVSDENPATKRDSWNLSKRLPSDDQRKEKPMIATYYQDSKEMKKGSPLGDGRNVWAGQGNLRNNDGSTSKVDFSLKGVGRTSLQPDEESHASGIQDLHEALQSFVYSQANSFNGLATSEDLAVIQLPKIAGSRDFGAITIRVSDNIREGHFRKHRENKAQFFAMFEYGAKRALNLNSGEALTQEKLHEYAFLLAKRLGSQSAKSENGYLFHRSPTQGNLTASGQIIDTGNMDFFSGFNGDPESGLTKYGDLQQVNKNYLHRLMSYIKVYDQVKFGTPVQEKTGFWSDASQEELQKMFQNTHDVELASLQLRRIGFNEKDLTVMEADCREQKASLLTKLHDLTSTEFAAKHFDFRRVLAYSLLEADINRVNYLKDTLSSSIIDKKAALAPLRDPNSDLYKKFANYLLSLRALLQCVDSKLSPEMRSSSQANRGKQARTSIATRVLKTDFHAEIDKLFSTMHAKSSKPDPLLEYSKQASDLAARLVDRIQVIPHPSHVSSEVQCVPSPAGPAEGTLAPLENVMNKLNE